MSSGGCNMQMVTAVPSEANGTQRTLLEKCLPICSNTNGLENGI